MALVKHVRLSELPAGIRSALESQGYRRPDVGVEQGTTFRPSEGSAAFAGNRGYVVVVDLATGRRHTERGSWGGPNPFERRAVDVNDTEYPIPPGCAIITGESGGRGAFAHVRVHPDNLAKLLPATDDVELSSDETRALQLIQSIRGGARRDEWRSFWDPEAMRHTSLPGEYGAENPIIVRLAELGFVKVNKAGAISITTEGKNAARA